MLDTMIFTHIVGDAAFAEVVRERLTQEEERLEEVFLKLRILEGVPVTSVADEVASRFMEQGLLRRVDGHLVPTERGMLLLNELVLGLAS
jgi:coproporphyrinogen III oxidase-like Fe-S oxidoreductase